VHQKTSLSFGNITILELDGLKKVETTSIIPTSSGMLISTSQKVVMNNMDTGTLMIWSDLSIMTLTKLIALPSEIKLT
jgi:hypothetical protein